MYNDTRFLSKTQLIMINQSNAGRFDPKVFVNCIQDVLYAVDKDLHSTNLVFKNLVSLYYQRNYEPLQYHNVYMQPSTPWLPLGSIHTVLRYRIGTLPNLFHGIAGTLYAQGNTTIVITNFHYDGLGPDAYLYVYRRGATVRSNGGGVIIPLSST